MFFAPRERVVRLFRAIIFHWNIFAEFGLAPVSSRSFDLLNFDVPIPVEQVIDLLIQRGDDLGGKIEIVTESFVVIHAIHQCLAQA